MDYLEVGHGDSVNHVLLSLFDPAEEVIECQHHDPWVLICPKHCIRLASPWEGGGSNEGGGGWEKEGGGRMGGGKEGRRREAVNYTARSEVFLNSVLKHGACHAPDRHTFPSPVGPYANTVALYPDVT